MPEQRTCPDRLNSAQVCPREQRGPTLGTSPQGDGLLVQVTWQRHIIYILVLEKTDEHYE